jgi:IS5 family transposase
METMRKILREQMQMGQIDIKDIVIELDNRDEIPQLLRGLQHLYANETTRHEIFKLLLKMVPKHIDINNGRNGMDLWKILVLGTLRLRCRWDYDKLQEIANNHHTLRQMLGHGMLDFTVRYARQTLNDNLRWFTPEILGQISRVAVIEGRRCLGVEPDVPLHGRCDSFVAETDVHFPTDINLLWDAARKTLQLTHRLCELTETAGWRQAPHLLKKVKAKFRTVQKMRDKEKNSTTKVGIGITATQAYIDTCAELFFRATQTATPFCKNVLYGGLADKILYFIEQGNKQIDQICRRYFKDEKIPHDEKVFSLFEPHTEWIVKGKAGITQELGLRVCIVESSDGFILYHMVMENMTDDQIAVLITRETKRWFPSLKSCSYDKGFHSPQNQQDLRKVLDFVVLPKKGKRNAEEQAHEGSEQFGELRRKHSAVESAINALEHSGLDRCRDYGLEGFKRYVALAIVARNIHRLGCILQEQEREKEKRRRGVGKKAA